MDRSESLPSPQAKLPGRLLVVLAAVLWSTAGLLAGAPTFDVWPAADRGPAQAFWRAVFASAILIPFVRRPRWSWKLVPMSLAFAAMNYFYLSALAQLPSAANAIWLQFTAPVWVLLVGVFVFGEKARRGDWFMFACSMLGVAFILAFEIRDGSFYGNVLALLSGVFYAMVVLSLRQLRDQESFWLIAVNHVVTALCLVPFAFKADVWPTEPSQWIILALLGVFQMAIPYVLFAIGVRSIPGHEATGIGLLEPVLLPVWVYIFLDKTTPWWTIVGAGFILSGLLIRYAGELLRVREEEPAPR